MVDIKKVGDFTAPHTDRKREPPNLFGHENQFKIIYSGAPAILAGAKVCLAETPSAPLFAAGASMPHLYHKTKDPQLWVKELLKN